MKNINFTEAVKRLKDGGNSLKDIGAMLFPSNTWPYLALNRVLNGADIPADAAKILSSRCGVSIDFILCDDWDISADGLTTRFTIAEATAIFNSSDGITSFYKHGIPLNKTLKHSTNTKLSTYISDITNVFLNY